MSIILINIISMAMKYETAGDTYNDSLFYCNLTFTFIFIIEAGLKIIAYGRLYFIKGWN